MMFGPVTQNKRDILKGRLRGGLTLEVRCQERATEEQREGLWKAQDARSLSLFPGQCRPRKQGSRRPDPALPGHNRGRPGLIVPRGRRGNWWGPDLFPGPDPAKVEARALRLEMGVQTDASPLLPSLFQSG